MKLPYLGRSENLTKGATDCPLKNACSLDSDMMPAKADRTHIGVALGFYPFDWKLKPEWGPLIHSINFGPFALTFIF